MKTLCMILITLALCMPAFATDHDDKDQRHEHDQKHERKSDRDRGNKSASASSVQSQQQSQNQSQTATGGNSTSGSTSANTTNIAAPQIPVSSAITPPIMPTVPCFKGFGGSAQTMAFGASFGGGKIDKGCNARELARSFSGPQTTASCKILLSTKEAKAAGITMEDCLPVPVQVVAPAVTVLLLPYGNIDPSSSDGLTESNRTVTSAVTQKAVHRRRHTRPCSNDSWVN